MLIILVPMLILQAVALQLFYGAHLDVISRRLAGGVAGDVAMLVELVRRERPENRAWIFREAAWRLDLALAYRGRTPASSSSPAPPACRCCRWRRT